MILAAIWAACQDFFGQNPDQIRISKRVFPGFPLGFAQKSWKMYDCQNFQTRRHRNYERSEFLAK